MNQQADIKIFRLFFKDYNLIREQFVLGQVSYHVTKTGKQPWRGPCATSSLTGTCMSYFELSNHGSVSR